MISFVVKYQKMILFLSTIFLLVFVFSAYSYADSSASTALQGINDTGGGSASGQAGVDNLIQTIIKVLLYIIGAVSVIMLIIGGFKYTLSGGNQESASSAKKTITYSIIGLIVAVLAYSIVNFVFKAVSGEDVTPSSSSSSSSQVEETTTQEQQTTTESSGQTQEPTTEQTQTPTN